MTLLKIVEGHIIHNQVMLSQMLNGQSALGKMSKSLRKGTMRDAPRLSYTLPETFLAVGYLTIAQCLALASGTLF